MPKATLAGHPLHPMLIAAPVALMPTSLVLDIIYLVTGKKSYSQASYYCLLGGYFGGLSAAAAGAADYFTIPSNTKAKKVANLHAVLNLGVMGAYSVNLLLRRNNKNRSTKATIILSALGNLGILVSSWYGGHLIYEHGLRVKGVDPTVAGSEAKIPGDEKIEEGFKRLEEYIAPEEPLQVKRSVKGAGL
jgi:uncharacterized membrane protein